LLTESRYITLFFVLPILGKLIFFTYGMWLCNIGSMHLDGRKKFAYTRVTLWVINFFMLT